MSKDRLNMIQLNQIIPILLLVVFSVACGGGGGGSSSSSQDVNFRFAGGKTGDEIYVYGLDGTFSEPSPFVNSATYGSDGIANIELDRGNYRVRLKTVSNSSVAAFEALEFIILESDFDRLEQDGGLNMGEMNAATTYISARAFASIESVSSKPRAAAGNITSYLSTYFSQRGLTSFSNATLTNIASSTAMKDELLWINLLAVNLRRLESTSETGDWSTVINSIVGIAEAFEADPDNIPSSVYLAYTQATSYLSDIDSSAISDALLGVSDEQELANILNLAQSSNASDFSSKYSAYLGTVVEDDYARLDLSTGEVSYFDDLTLTVSDNSDFIVFKKVLASTSLYRTSETATTSISLSEYYLSVFEVTQAQYAKRMITFQADETNNPITSISQANAILYTDSLNNLESGLTFKLPTEAQWETAARNSQVAENDFSTKVSGSDSWICFDNNGLDTEDEPVGLSAPNAYGFYDMNGNVAEMCLDSLTTVTSGQLNPIGSTTAIAIRGGSFINPIEFCTVGAKSTASTTNTNPAIGFRVVFTK